MPRLEVPPATETLFVILSLKYSGEWLMWWGSERKGYVYDLDDAGRYTRADVATYHLDNGKTTRAIPLRQAYAAMTRAVRLDHLERMTDLDSAGEARAAIAEHTKDRT